MSRGGKKTKKKKTKAQQAAAKRHATFKKTRVQTFGGTKKKYSKAEARRIENAGLSFSKVTGGAANPLNRARGDQGVKAGDLVQPVKDFNTFLGNDYSMFAAPQVNYNYNQRPKSDISFSDAVRMSGARFNEAGRNEVNQNVATHDRPLFKSVPARLDQPASKDFIDGMLQRNINPAKPGDLYGIGTKTAMLPGDNMGGPAAILGGVVPLTIMGANAVKNLYQNTVPKIKEKLEKRYDTGEDVSTTGIGDMSNLVASTNLSGLGMTPKTTTGYDPGSTAYALRTGDFDPASYEKFKASQQQAGGLNIGGNFGLSADESDRLGRVFQQTPSPRMLSEGGDLRMSDMFEADTPGATLSKGINTIKNRIPILNMLPDMKINTVAEEAQRRYLGYNPNLPASALARMDRRGGGGTRLPMTPTVAQEVAPQYQPVPSASTTPTTQTGVDPNRLLQIQQQAYAQAYNPMLIGGFNPQFRFGAATPTIDYSTYFNY